MQGPANRISSTCRGCFKGVLPAVSTARTRKPARAPAKKSGRARLHDAPPRTYRQALVTMRLAAQDGVAEAISDAHHAMARDVSHASQQPSAGETAHALFDGVAQALAENILMHSLPGRAETMARMIGDLVVAKIHAMSCQGCA